MKPSREWILHVEIDALIGKLARGAATEADKAQLQHLQRIRVDWMQPAFLQRH